MLDEWMSMEHYEYDTDKGKLKYMEGNLPLYAPQIPHALALIQTQTSVVRD